ncbi:hypothetical protein [Corynebacterium guaraldiae]|nr:hypothetical protein [Corynebacterium guaraldiae]
MTHRTQRLKIIQAVVIAPEDVVNLRCSSFTAGPLGPALVLVSPEDF